MTEAARTIESCGISIDSIRRGAPWVYFEDYQERYTRVIATLGRECRDWAEGKTNDAVEAIIAEHGGASDLVIFTDGSVKRGIKSGWGYTVRVDGEMINEASGASELTTSSMVMEIKAITEALQYVQREQHKRAIIVTDSMSTLQKITSGFLYADWVTTISNSVLEKLTWIFTPGHAGVHGNERADSLADTAVIDNNITLDAATVIQVVSEQLKASRPNSTSYTLSLLKEKGVQPGEGAKNNHRGTSRRQQNQILMETMSLHTLRSSLAMRAERVWVCPTCNDANGDNKY